MRKATLSSSFVAAESCFVFLFCAPTLKKAYAKKESSYTAYPIE
ncbi:hypothetical protein DB42_EV00070 [Neochlamydia sp. EPS4]|nr:hypothetical protein DB42_EV00070 [Neochlamydia sp. EPS4]